MNILVIGPLRPHPRIPEWLTSDPVPVPYFDGDRLAFVLAGLGDAYDLPEEQDKIA